MRHFTVVQNPRHCSALLGHCHRWIETNVPSNSSCCWTEPFRDCVALPQEHWWCCHNHCQLLRCWTPSHASLWKEWTVCFQEHTDEPDWSSSARGGTVQMSSIPSAVSETALPSASFPEKIVVNGSILVSTIQLGSCCFVLFVSCLGAYFNWKAGVCSP